MHNLTVNYRDDFNFEPGTWITLLQVVTDNPTITILKTVAPSPASAQGDHADLPPSVLR